MKVEKPIFIVGAPRSGTTFVGVALEKHPDIAVWPETNNVWMWGHAYKLDDTLSEKDLTPKIKKHIEEKFFRYLKKSGRKRICDKTPRNCLRLRYVLAVFPDAKIIHVVRDGRAVINSTKNEYTKHYVLPSWKSLQNKLGNLPIWEWYVYIPRLTALLKRAMGISLDYWGARPPGWDEWVGKLSPQAVLAKQWVSTIEIATQEGRKLPPENYLEIHYEDFIASSQETIARIANFAEIEDPAPIIEFCSLNADPSRNNKWKKSIDPNTLDEIRKIIEPTMAQLGYIW